MSEHPDNHVESADSGGAGDSHSELAAVPDPSLTLAGKRLAGSAACLNCGTELKGPFCFYCGQPDRNFMRFFPALLRELLEDFLDFDSRFARTMKPLLFKPGRLTRDYLDGKRFRYTPPLRLYLFSSIAFFVLFAFYTSWQLADGETGVSAGTGIKITASTPEEAEEVQKALESLPGPLRETVEVEIDDGETGELSLDGDELNFNGEPWDRETNPLDIPWLPASINEWLNDEIARSPEKGDMISENPDLIVDKVFDILPATMFVLLPVVAFILKFWYLFASKYYIEHLILALHNHSFIFVSMINLVLLEMVEAWSVANGYDSLNDVSRWLSYAIGVWIPVYLIWSLKTVYRQNWFLTIGKGLIIGISYMTLLTFAAVSVALISFLMI